MSGLALLAASAFAYASNKPEATDHYKRGIVAWDHQQYDEALREFEISYGLFESYLTLENIGHSYEMLGRPDKAVAIFERCLAEAGATFNSQERANIRRALAAQEPHVGRLLISVSPVHAEVRLDSSAIVLAPANAKGFPVLPGAHVIEASLAGYQTATKPVDVKEKETLPVELQLETATAQNEGASSVAAVASTGRAEGDTSPVGEGSENPAAPSTGLGSFPQLPAPLDLTPTWSSSDLITQPRIAYGLLGIGVISIGVGLVIAIDGQGKHDEALQEWSDGDRDTARQTEAESSDQKTYGYVTMGLGGAAAVAGTILLLTVPEPDKEHAQWSLSPWAPNALTGATVQGVW